MNLRNLLFSRIDWNLLANAVSFYEAHGFDYVELPYFVPDPVARITCPGEPSKIVHAGFEKGALVGSAEQSFLDAAPSRGLYVGVTPCFREEAQFTRLSQPHFMKVELFDNREEADPWQLLLIAQRFMSSYSRAHVGVETTSAGWDLFVGGVEVGSYGARHCTAGSTDLRWAYGTGLALPRFSLAVSDSA